MVEFFALLSALLAVAGLHAAYESGKEAGKEAGVNEALRLVREDAFRAVREECARSEVSRQELQGSYRMMRRLVTRFSREDT